MRKLESNLREGRSEERRCTPIGYVCLVTLCGKVTRCGPTTVSSLESLDICILLIEKKVKVSNFGETKSLLQCCCIYSWIESRNLGLCLFNLLSKNPLFMFLNPFSRRGCNLWQSHFCLALSRLLYLHRRFRNHFQGLSTSSSI